MVMTEYDLAGPAGNPVGERLRWWASQLVGFGEALADGDGGWGRRDERQAGRRATTGAGMATDGGAGATARQA